MITDNLPLADLQKIITGDRCEPLSILELRELLSGEKSQELILYIYLALVAKLMDPNELLVQAIANSHERKDMILVGLALRFGADPNMYATVPKLGTIHILAYTYIVLTDRLLPLLNGTVLMLMEQGADINLPVFSLECGEVRDEYSLLEPIKGLSVVEYLDNQGYDNILAQVQIEKYKNVQDGLMNTIAVYLNKPELLRYGADITDVITAYSDNVLDSINEQEYYMGLLYCRNSGWIYGYEYFVDKGQEFNYADINNSIILIGTYKDTGYVVMSKIIRTMLIYSVNRGLQLDDEQVALMISYCPCLVEPIMEAYKQPYYKKVCRNMKIPIHDKLKILAYRLNLYPEAPKETLCSQIKDISMTDPEVIQCSSVERQQTRLVSNLSLVNGYVQNCNCSCYTGPKIVINNKAKICENVYQLTDVDIAYYRDYNNMVWCFTSNNYEKMLDKIVSIEKVDVVNYPKVYDLTVPSTLNFGLANGLHVVDTADTGHMHHRMVKALEDIKVFDDGSVRNAFGVLFELSYGGDGFDAGMTEGVETKTGKFANFISTRRLAGKLNTKYGYTTPGEPEPESINPVPK